MQNKRNLLHQHFLLQVPYERMFRSILCFISQFNDDLLVHILVKFGLPSDRLLGNSCSGSQF